MNDLKVAVRILWRDKAFAALAIGVLTLGLAATLFVATTIKAYIFTPLPYGEPAQLVNLRYTHPENPRNPIAPQDLALLEQAFAGQVSLSAFYTGSVNLSGDDRPERYDGAYVDARLAAVLDVRPALGRWFRAEDDQPGAPLTVILSDTIWQHRYGADPTIIGRTVRVNARDATVIGVMRPEFSYPGSQVIWVPRQFDAARETRDSARWLNVVGRASPGLGLEAIEAAAVPVVAQLEREFPDTYTKMRLQARSAQDESVDPNLKRMMFTFFAVVFAVLLIACANVSNLIIVRTVARTRELAVRRALGASGRQVAGLVVAEGLVLSLAATLCALPLAQLANQTMARVINSSDTPRPPWMDISIDWRIVVVAASMAVLATLIATLVPAWRSAREDITKGLKDGSGAARGAGRAGRFFVIAEVALSCALLFGATLMLKSLINSQAVEIGAETDRVLTGRVALFEAKYPDATAQVAYFEQLAQRLGALPGVTASGLTSSLPGTVVNAQPYSLEGEPVVPGEARFAETVIADPGFFTVFGIKAREGRLIDARDRADSQPAVVINQRFADLHWPGANALGKRVVLGERTLTVVGVINDVQQSRVGQPIRPGMYLPLAQNPTRFMTAAFRTPDEPLLLAEPFRDLLLSLDPDTPAYWVRSMDDWLERGTFGFNLHAMMFLCFAVIALTLAAVGLYAVLAHAVAQRTREFGIRRSLGADDRAVLSLVFGEAARFVGLGLIIGAVLALGLGRLLSMGLFGVSGSDPAALALVVGVLGVVAVIAALVPARRALAVEPTVALREE